MKTPAKGDIVLYHYTADKRWWDHRNSDRIESRPAIVTDVDTSDNTVNLRVFFELNDGECNRYGHYMDMEEDRHGRYSIPAYDWEAPEPGTWSMRREDEH